MHWDAIVIGGGLGGLTAGAMCAQAGLRVLLVERTGKTGGAATTFDRRGHRFEVSLRETLNPSEAWDTKGRVFNALDLHGTLQFVPIPNAYRVIAPHLDIDIFLPFGADAILETLSGHFPDDVDNIRGFLRYLTHSLDAISLLADRHSGTWWQGSPVTLPMDHFSMYRDFGASLSAVLTRYFGNNERLKLMFTANLCCYTDDPDRFWWMAYAQMMGGILLKGGCYVQQGSSQLVQAMGDLITRNDGEIRVNAPVDEILVSKSGRAFGVRLTDGQEFHATSIFGNAAPDVLTDMLPPHLTSRLQPAVQKSSLSISLFDTYLGLSRPAETFGVDSYISILVPDWMTKLSDFRQAGTIMGDATVCRLPPLVMVDYGQIDSQLGKNNVGPISVSGVDRLENWKTLPPADYRAKKGAWMAAITRRLDQQWPGLSGAIEVQGMATAKTVARYLCTPRGAAYGYAPVPPLMPMTGKTDFQAKTAIPGLWLASSYGGQGGYSGAMACGAAAAQSAVRAHVRSREMAAGLL